jgi:AcrR family transcriptional regulator
MLNSTATLIRERGASATSLDNILAHSGTPRGSIYHHFPGGREQLLEEAVDRAGAVVARLIAAAGNATPLEVFDAFVASWREGLEDTGFRAGCPVLAVSIEVDVHTPTLNAAAARAFTSWRGALIELLKLHGASPVRARRLAALIVAAVEGAVVLCRADRSLQPLDDVARELRPLLQPFRSSLRPASRERTGA